MYTRTRPLSFGVLLLLLVTSSSHGEMSATDLVQDMYMDCLSELSTSCVKPKALGWMSRVADQDAIKITNDLSLVRTGANKFEEESGRANVDPKLALINKVDNFFATHALEVRPSPFFKSEGARSIVPDWLLQGGLTDKQLIPLSGTNLAEGRGFIRKVMVPFILGLKLKTTILVPLALALIALKTWKAMTFGLLSLLLSGALVIFKLLKPNVYNYEVVHPYPHEHVVDHHHLDHLGYHADHHHDHHHVEHVVGHHEPHLEHIVDHHHGPHFDHFTDHHHEPHFEHLVDHHHHEPHFEHLVDHHHHEPHFEHLVDHHHEPHFDHLVDHHHEPHFDHLVDHHHDHHIDVEHIEPVRIETASQAPQSGGWQPSAEYGPPQDVAQNLAYSAQRRR